MRRLVVALSLALAACGHEGKNLSGVTRVAPPGQAAAPAPEPPAANPHAATPPVDPHAGMTPAAPAASASPVAWSVPDGWKESTPTSKMRLAQFDLPGGGAQCVVFQGIGGDDESNLERWISQMGDAAAATAKKTTLEKDGVKVARLEAHGSYTDTMDPRQPKAVASATMLAAIVTTTVGKLHVKLVGPSDVVDANAAKFDAFVASIRAR